MRSLPSGGNSNYQMVYNFFIIFVSSINPVLRDVVHLYLTRIFEKNFGKEDSSVFRVFPSNYINFRLSNFV